MNPCKNNHDRDVVGINKWRQCNQCAKDWNRKRSQDRRTRAKARLRYPDPPNRVKPLTDGLEGLYGPVPDLVPDSEWFDEVIVLRALNKRPTGRTPFPLEWVEIIRRMPRAEVADEDVARATGTTFRHVSEIRVSLRG